MTGREPHTRPVIRTGALIVAAWLPASAAAGAAWALFRHRQKAGAMNLLDATRGPHSWPAGRYPQRNEIRHGTRAHKPSDWNACPLCIRDVRAHLGLDRRPER